jgi:hypothetical protein
MTRASFLDRVITMQLESKYRRNLDFCQSVFARKSPQSSRSVLSAMMKNIKTIISSQIKDNNFVGKLFFAGTF